VVSGDYLTQMHLKAGAELPQVGSDAYRKMYAAQLSAMNGEPDAPRSLSYASAAPGTGGAAAPPGTIVLDEAKGWRFEAYTPVEVPADAHEFLSPADAVAKQGSLTPLDYPVPYEMAVFVTGHFKRIYPEVAFKIDWNSDLVNANAYKIGTQRFVVLRGGFIRHVAIQAEGLELITAHEVGHHYAGPPRFVGQWGSCEGQSDYWGAKVAMRAVWWGSEAPARTERGAQQLYQLFASGLLSGNILERDRRAGSLAGSCGRPPAQCRLDTFRAGIRLDPKPACAGGP
jgi:hypothetical protein